MLVCVARVSAALSGLPFACLLVGLCGVPYDRRVYPPELRQLASGDFLLVAVVVVVVLVSCLLVGSPLW